MKLTGLTSAIVALSLFGAATAQAETYGEGLSINPGAGYYNFDKDLIIKDKTIPAIGFEYRFTQNLAAEVQYMNGETHEKINSLAKYDVEQYRLDGHYYFMPERKLQPFLSAGFGMINLDQEEKNIHLDDTIANVGAGVRYFFNEDFSVRGDFRAIDNFEGDYTDTLASLALTMTFGGNENSSEGDIDLVDAGAAQGEMIADADGDGILDNIDECLDTAAGLMVDERGCAIPIENTVSMDLNVNFAFESSNLPPEFYSDVKELATFLKLYKDSIVTIEGHADSTGPSAFNQKLSEKRAKAIRDILVRDFEIQKDRLEIIGYGEEKPIATNETEEGRSRNRRAATLVTATRQLDPEQAQQPRAQEQTQETAE